MSYTEYRVATTVEYSSRSSKGTDHSQCETEVGWFMKKLVPHGYLQQQRVGFWPAVIFCYFILNFWAGVVALKVAVEPRSGWGSEPSQPPILSLGTQDFQSLWGISKWLITLAFLFLFFYFSFFLFDLGFFLALCLLRGDMKQTKICPVVPNKKGNLSHPVILYVSILSPCRNDVFPNGTSTNVDIEFWIDFYDTYIRVLKITRESISTDCNLMKSIQCPK